MRVTYSVLVIVANIKIMNILQFYEGIAFMVEIMENMAGELAPVMVFLFGIISVFALAAAALDVVYWNADMQTETGDYLGIGYYGASVMSMLRNSLGDFDISTYKFLPLP